MLGDSQLNVYVIGDDLSPRQRVQLQAQLDSALRALPLWCLDLVRDRLSRTGVKNFPIVVEPVLSEVEGPQPASGDVLPLSLGRIEGRPAAYLRPRLDGDRIDWLQDRRYLVAKAAAYIVVPPPDEDAAFYDRWSRAIAADGLREVAATAHEAWAAASDADLLIEMFAAYALNPSHPRWAKLPSVRGFLEEWKKPGIATYRPDEGRR